MDTRSFTVFGCPFIFCSDQDVKENTGFEQDLMLAENILD